LAFHLLELKLNLLEVFHVSSIVLKEGFDQLDFVFDICGPVELALKGDERSSDLLIDLDELQDA